jgi:poly-gamma-glutamate biosynthesis protein PgsC/CapC
MIDLSSLFVGVGLAVSLTFSEFFGLAAGGLVVPGYVAFNMGRPAMVFSTLVVAFLTYLVVRGIAGFTIVYGRRRTVLMILTGYLLGILMRFLMTSVVDTTEFAIIGYIVPGLIAIWMDRQGVVETLATLLTASAITRLAMILVTGGEFLS